jgi:hypothetical protein
MVLPIPFRVALPSPTAECDILSRIRADQGVALPAVYDADRIHGDVPMVGVVAVRRPVESRRHHAARSAAVAVSYWRFIREAIANAVDCHHIAGIGGVGFELLAQILDMRINAAGQPFIGDIIQACD